MILQTYYRQHNYKPIYALRSSVSLLLQIPFFKAAYSFLSNVQAFKNASFGSISDLSLPDGLLFGLNLFPIAMTMINVISSIIYTKGQPAKDSIQLFAMAFIFLLLLYNAPAALSFYYLLNNVFSLLKNIFEKIPNKLLMTYFTDNKGSLLLIQNSSTHEPIYLSDDYSYSTTDYDDKKYDGTTMNKKSLYNNDSIVLDSINGSESQIAHYQVNMAAIIQLGEWFDYLKENNLYDNTRIIIVSDHGRGLGLFDDLVTENDDYILYNALLLYKDFDSKGFQKDNSFMTNSDVVYLATEGVIESPINPFTGKEIKKRPNHANC